MGVSRREVLMIGVRLSGEEYEQAGGFETFEKYDVDFKNANQGNCILYDGMNGKYAIVGLLIYASDDMRFGDNEGFPLLEIKDIDKITSAFIKQFVKEKFNIEREVAHYIVSHFY